MTGPRVTYPASAVAGHIMAACLAREAVWYFSGETVCKLARTTGYRAVLNAAGYDDAFAVERWYDDRSLVVTCTTKLLTFDDDGCEVVVTARGVA